MREEFEAEVSGPEAWLVDPGLVGRPAWDVERAQRDVELLQWIGRFRFVTGRLVAVRFGISWQRANARLRRLERLGLVGFEQRHVCEARAVFLTSKGSVLIGGERRRAPRAETQREHELAVVVLATSIEHDRPDLAVVTERECRRRDRDGDMRWSVDVHAPARGPRRHWPDLVVVDGTRRTAVEVEFAPKASDRLRRILEAYSVGRFDEVRYLVRSPALAARIGALTFRAGFGRQATGSPGRVQLTIAPWPGVDGTAAAGVRAAIPRAFQVAD